jgi:hypothetical protein
MTFLHNHWMNISKLGLSMSQSTEIFLSLNMLHFFFPVVALYFGMTDLRNSQPTET